MSTGTNQVGPITISNRKARRQLLKKGEVITFRAKDRTTGETWARRSHGGEKIADVKVSLLKKGIDPRNSANLEPHLAKSGLGSVREWQETIGIFSQGVVGEGNLYRVILTEAIE